MALKRSPAFDPQTFLSKVGNGNAVKKYRKDEIVFAQGDRADSICYIQKGRVKIQVVSEHGKEAVIAIVGAGDFLGEGCLGGERKRMATVAALEECTISSIGKAVMMHVLNAEPKLSQLFIAYLLGRNIRIQADLVDHLFNSSEKRLARLLLLLSNFGKDDDPGPVTPRISQETLAEMIGTTRARVSFFMNKFRRLGLIEYKGTIKVYSGLLALVLHE